MNRIILLLFILLILFINSYAQPIPNNSFETWSGGEPDNWNTTNQISVFVFNTVKKDLSGPQQGSASAELTTVTKTFFPFGTYSVPGLLTLGNLNVDLFAQTFSLSGGYPFTGRPQKLKGYFKYQPVGNDRCIFGIGLFKWNIGKQDTLGIGGIDTLGTFNSWTQFEIPIHYLMQDDPDTMNIVILSSIPLDTIDHNGTKLWVDNLSFDYGTVGIEGITFAKDLRIYAEPYARQLIISSSFGKLENLDISLFNMAGTETRHWKRRMQLSTEHLDISNLLPGTYVLRISSGNRLIDTRKITILN
jgi:hypothetical protein